MLTVPIFERVDDRWSAVQRFLRALAPIIALPDGAHWCLDLSECRYIGPDAATLIYSTVLSARQRGQRPVVHLPTEPPALDAFCTFSGLRHYLARGDRPRPDHPLSETVPLQQFYQAVGNQSAPIVRLVRRHVELDDDSEFYLGAALSEVVQNIEDHAQSPIGGVSCARFLSGSGEVRVAVVDRGIGIAATLSRTHPGVGAREALALVLQGEHSGKSHERNMGLGLSNVAAIVRNHRGDLVVVSGDAAAETSSADPGGSFHDLPTRFPGTAIFFRLNVGRDANGRTP